MPAILAIALILLAAAVISAAAAALMRRLGIEPADQGARSRGFRDVLDWLEARRDRKDPRP